MRWTYSHSLVRWTYSHSLVKCTCRLVIWKLVKLNSQLPRNILFEYERLLLTLTIVWKNIELDILKKFHGELCGETQNQTPNSTNHSCFVVWHFRAAASISDPWGCSFLYEMLTQHWTALRNEEKIFESHVNINAFLLKLQATNLQFQLKLAFVSFIVTEFPRVIFLCAYHVPHIMTSVS